MGDIVGIGSSMLLSKLDSFGFGRKERRFAYELLEDMYAVWLDPYVHSVYVMNRGVKYARVLGLDEKRMRFACLVHDVGKLGVDRDLLDKTGVYSDDEFEAMKAHPEIGYSVLDKAGFPEAAKVAREHHMFQPKKYPNTDVRELGSYSGVVSLADFSSARVRDDGRYNGSKGFDAELIRRERGGLTKEIDLLLAADAFG